MAKNKVEIDVKVDDKGTTKKVGLGAKKAAKGLDELGKGARTADRNLKGAAQASSNGTKNFSKMAQGTNGLVGAYATLAANIFAISAAFQFLKASADFRVTRDSQIAFSGATGQGMKSLTSDLQAASEGMLSFQAASEAASIGVASGLSAGQLNELSAGASNLSKILGRDVTDSFNRLVRGVTKAEPELLDELGITLRLADAQENYATSLDKSAKDLSNFEKKQAIFLEVQSQLESKYNSVAEATDVQGNAINKLAVAFDKVLNPLKSFVATIAEPVAEFFSKNIAALAITLGLLAIPLIKQIIPGLDGFAAAAEASAVRASAAFDKTKLDIEELAQANTRLKTIDPSKAGAAALKGVKTTPGSGAALMQAGEKPNNRQLKSMRRWANKNKGIVADMSKHQKRQYIAAIDAMIAGNSRLSNSLRNTATGIKNQMTIAAKTMQVTYHRAFVAIGRGAAMAGKAMNTAMKMAGLIGIALMVKDLVKMGLEMAGFLNVNKSIQAYADKVEDLTNKAKENNKEFEKFADIQLKLRQIVDKDTKEIIGIKGTTIKGVEAMGAIVERVSTQILEMNDALLNKVDFTSVLAGAEKLAEVDGRRVIAAQKLVDLSQEKAVLDKTGVHAARKELLKTYIPDNDRKVKDAQTVENTGIGSKLLTDLADTKALKEERTIAASILIEGLKATGLASTQAGIEYTAYLQKIAAGADLSGKAVTKFKELSEQFSENGQKAQFAGLQQKELNKQYTKQMNSLSVFTTKQTNLIKLLEDQIAVNGKLEYSDKKKENIELLHKQLRITKQLQDIEIGYANQASKLAAITAGASIGATKNQKAQIARQSKIIGIDIKRQKIIDTINLANEAGDTISEAQTTNYANQLQLLTAQADELKRAGEEAAILKDSMKNAFEGSLESGLADVIKGQESSFKGFILGIAESTLNAAADALAKIITGSITDLLFDSPEVKMKNAHIEGGKLAAAEIKAAYGGGLLAEKAPVDTLLETSSTVTPKAAAAATIAAPAALGVVTTTAVTETGAEMAEVVTTGSKKAVIPFVSAFDDFFANFKTGELSLGESLKGLFTDIGVDFKGIFDGLGDMFGSMFKGLFGGDGGDGIMSSISTGISSMFGAPAAARNGGVFSAGQKVPGYATGGIARGSTSGYPATLHGTEAVVPLPHGGKIPVEMKGGGSQQNNVVVNISNEGQAQTQSSSGMDADKLGQAVAAAVQVEMQNQKRSGGILNPYGVA